MTDAKFDVLGIGNAIVDVIAQTEEDFLVREKLIKGSMRLIETSEAERLYGLMGQAIQTSGGCAGNTAAGVASFGGRAAFIGKVADDGLGHVYRHDMHALGIDFATAPLKNHDPTARSMILITPDGERTMNTYLGASRQLSPPDIDEGVVAAARITYLEGYLWDPPLAKEAFRKAAAVAHRAGRQVALTLSDSFCVDRFRDEFIGLIRDGSVDVLFANGAELHSLYQTADFDTALNLVRQDAKLAAVTVGGQRGVRRQQRRRRDGARSQGRPARRHDRGRRPLRRGLPLRALPRPAPCHLRRFRPSRRSRGDRPHRPAAGHVVARVGGAVGTAGVAGWVFGVRFSVLGFRFRKWVRA